MTRQTTEAYEDIFSFLKSYGINFKEIVLDFEYASRKAVLRSFPGSAVIGCFFHFSQVIFDGIFFLKLIQFLI